MCVLRSSEKKKQTKRRLTVKSGENNGLIIRRRCNCVSYLLLFNYAVPVVWHMQAKVRH